MLNCTITMFGQDLESEGGRGKEEERGEVGADPDTPTLHNQNNAKTRCLEKPIMPRKGVRV